MNQRLNSLFGALTAKAYAFASRSWELEERFSFDFTDSMLISLKFFFRGLELIRVLPGMRDFTGVEWIADRSRFFYSSLKLQRLDFPLLRFVYSRVLKPVAWLCVFYYYSSFKLGRFLSAKFFKLNGFYNSIFGKDVLADAVIGRVSLDFLTLWRRKFAGLNCIYYNSNYVQTLLMNSRRVEFCSLELDLGFNGPVNYLFLYFNPRLELPLLNIHFRANVVAGKSIILSFGVPAVNLNYKIYNLGLEFLTLLNFVGGRLNLCKFFSLSSSGLQVIRGSPALFVHQNVLGSFSFQLLCFKILGLVVRSFSLCSVLQNPMLINLNEIGLPVRLTLADCFFQSFILYVVESNEIAVRLDDYALIVYQGFQAEMSSQFADLVLPTKSIFESPFLTYDYQLNLKRFEPPINAKFGKSSTDVFTNLDNFCLERKRLLLNLNFDSVANNRYVIKRVLKNFYLFFCGSVGVRLNYKFLSAQGIYFHFVCLRSIEGLMKYLVGLFIFRNIFFLPVISRIVSFRGGMNLVGFSNASLSLSSLCLEILNQCSQIFNQVRTSSKPLISFGYFYVVIKLYFLKSVFRYLKKVWFYNLLVQSVDYECSNVGGFGSLTVDNFLLRSDTQNYIQHQFKNLVYLFTNNSRTFLRFLNISFRVPVLFADKQLSSLIRYSKVLFLKSRYFETYTTSFSNYF